MGKRGRPLGGTKFTSSNLSLQKKTKINPNAKPTKIENPDAETGFRCTCCGKTYKYQRNNFAVSNSPLYAGNNGYLSVCKNCVDKYFLQLVDFFTGNEEKAMERCCQIFDWYYNNEAVAMTAKSLTAGKTRISLYPGKLNMQQIKQKGTTFLDTLTERHSTTIDTIDDIDMLECEDENNDSENVEPIDRETVMYFGTGYTPDEYRYLKHEYEDWTTRYETKTKAQEELFKNLCIAQLTIQQTKQKGDSKGFSDATKTFQDLLGSANLKPNQNNDNSLTEQNTFGALIKMWEEQKPIPEPDEEFKDVDNIKKYIDTFFFGHLAEMMKIDNDYSEQYREEMGKYTVERQQYVGDIDELEDNSDDEGEKNGGGEETD